MKKMLAFLMAAVMAGSMASVPQTVKASELIPVEGDELEASQEASVVYSYVEEPEDEILPINWETSVRDQIDYYYVLSDGENWVDDNGSLELYNFRSSDSSVVDLVKEDDTLFLKPRAVGSAVISADYDVPEVLDGYLSGTVSYTVYVSEYELQTRVAVNPDSYTVVPGQQVDLYMTGSGFDADGEILEQDDLKDMTISWIPMNQSASARGTITPDSEDPTHAVLSIKSDAIPYDSNPLCYRMEMKAEDGQVVSIYTMYFNVEEECCGLYIQDYDNSFWELGETRTLKLDVMAYQTSASTGGRVPYALVDAVITDDDYYEVPYVVNEDGSISVTCTRESTGTGELAVDYLYDGDDYLVYLVLYPSTSILEKALNFGETELEVDADAAYVDVTVTDAAFKAAGISLDYQISYYAWDEEADEENEIDLETQILSSDDECTILRVTLPEDFRDQAYLVLNLRGNSEEETFWSYNSLEVYNSGFVYTPESQMIRVAGQNRYTTAVESANALKDVLGIEKFDNIVLASGEDFPDALAGGPLATELEAPILLVSKKSATVALNYVYNNLKAGGNVYLLGGNIAVPQTVEDTLNSKGYHVERVAGANRYGTDAAIIRKMMEVSAANEFLGDIDSVVVVQAMGYADSLSVSGVAGGLNMPIILAPKDGLTSEQANLIKQIAPENIYIIGGTVAVTEKTETILKNLAADIEDCSVKRVAGANRFTTSIAIAEEFEMYYCGSAVLAYAMNFPDGLTGGVLAGTMGAPVILVSDKGYRPAANFFAREDCYTENYYVVGGIYVIPDATVEQIMKKWD